mmetsp:Transcript_12097/g.27927  ORF Transcript_12097/g.27927 Transcript_12097/m.27927 type:complete len:81 (+) Transcript_12097:659-901(+)
MIGATTCWVDHSAANALHENFIINSKLNHGVQLLVIGTQHFVERMSLRDCAGESIQDKSVSTVAAINPLCNQLDHKLVRN